jgi:hypothetical protein
MLAAAGRQRQVWRLTVPGRLPRPPQALCEVMPTAWWQRPDRWNEEVWGWPGFEIFTRTPIARIQNLERKCIETRSTPEVWDPKKSGLYKEQLSNKVWLFFPQKHLNLHLFGFQEKFESNRPGKFESNGPFEPIDVAQ